MNQTLRTFQMAGWLTLVIVLTSCGRTPVPETYPVQPSPKIFPTATLGLYPVSITPTSPPPSVSAATKASDQEYKDPMGWYSVKIPADWQSTGVSNSFSGENGFFETGYLPERMFMQYLMDVCQWVANIDTKATYSVSLSERLDSCILTSLPDITPASAQKIYMNPAANNPERYFYIRTDVEHFQEITGSFVSKMPFERVVQPTNQLAPLRPEDISFWDKVSPLPAGFTVKEYILPEKMQNTNPSNNILEIPPAVPKRESKIGGGWVAPTWESINQKIKLFGYEFRDSTQANLRQLFKDGKALIDNVYQMPTIYLFSTLRGEKIAFLVYALKDANLPAYDRKNYKVYLVQNDGATEWKDGPPNPIDFDRAPILFKDDLLWVQVADETQAVVKDTRGKILFSFSTYWGARVPINGFTAWNDHWILEISNFVIQDGVILNKEMGFEEVFNWTSVNSKPFYFFRKGPRVGISYDGQYLPLYYQEVAHDYCCGLMSNNPSVDGNTVRFFAKKNGVWYYVIVDVQ